LLENKIRFKKLKREIAATQKRLIEFILQDEEKSKVLELKTNIKTEEDQMIEPRHPIDMSNVSTMSTDQLPEHGITEARNKHHETKTAVSSTEVAVAMDLDRIPNDDT
jgi:ribosomal protein L24